MNGFLRWAGSKRQLLPKLREYWDDSPGRRYIEPFAGSACLFFDIEPTAAVLGDLNPELIGMLTTLRDNPRAVLDSLQDLPRGKASYYRIRAQQPEELPPHERAARFIFLNKYCFNGLYRTNKSGHFNVPYATPKTKGKIANIDFGSIRLAATLLQRTTLVAGDFEQTLTHATPGDFVYLDPPYFSTTKRIFGDYMPSVFKAEDLERLSDNLDLLDSKGIHFLVSYIWTAEHRHIFRRWTVKRVRTRRNIAGFSSDRRGAYEILATNIDG
jgi:DNA adenine methylase